MISLNLDIVVRCVLFAMFLVLLYYALLVVVSRGSWPEPNPQDIRVGLGGVGEHRFLFQQEKTPPACQAVMIGFVWVALL